MLESRILSADVVGVGPAPIIMPAINAPALKAAESYPCAKTEATPMESHPYTKTRGVGPVTTQLTPGVEPASSKSAGAPGPWSCSPTCRAWSESSMPSFTDSTSNAKTTPSAFLHKQLTYNMLGRLHRSNSTRVFSVEVAR